MRASSSSDYYAAPGSLTHEANLKSAPGVMVRAENYNAEAGWSPRRKSFSSGHTGKGGQGIRERCVAYSVTSVPVYIGFFTPM